MADEHGRMVEAWKRSGQQGTIDDGWEECLALRKFLSGQGGKVATDAGAIACATVIAVAARSVLHTECPREQFLMDCARIWDAEEETAAKRGTAPPSDSEAN